MVSSSYYYIFLTCASLKFFMTWLAHLHAVSPAMQSYLYEWANLLALHVFNASPVWLAFIRSTFGANFGHIVRYYVGHKGKFGHEFLEFEFRHGKLRYANNSQYKNDSMIRKECFVSEEVVGELKRIIEDSEVTKEDDNLWPMPDRAGRQVSATCCWQFYPSWFYLLCTRSEYCMNCSLFASACLSFCWTCWVITGAGGSTWRWAHFFHHL